MKTIPVASLGTPPSFTISTDNPLYWLLRICYEESLDRYNRKQQGFVENCVESSDFTTAETAFDTLGTDIKTWIDSAINASADGNEPTAFDTADLPDIITFVALLATQNWGAIFLLFVKVGLKAVLDFSRKSLDPATSTGDMVELLKQTIAVLDDDGNVVGCRLDGLTNLHITVNTEQDLQDSLWGAAS